MKLGFTGTRNGMSIQQKAQVEILLKIIDVSEVHMGDCVGADKDMHQICYALGIKTIGHPPDNNTLRAFCNYDEERAPKYYTERNKDIVEESDLIIATPDGPEKIRSGTWHAIRHARRIDKKVILVMP